MTAHTPEQHARQRIDRLLEQSGWAVQDYRRMHITAAPGVAIREFPLQTGFADYMLYADGKAIGVVEAKLQGHTLTGVEVGVWSNPVDGSPDQAIRPQDLTIPLASFLQTTEYRRQVSRLAAGSNINNLRRSHIELLPIRLAPLPEQGEIVAAVEDRLSQIARAEHAVSSAMRRAARLRQAILKRAFEGKLVPQDPTDEPAIALLERIRAQAPPEASRIDRRRQRTTAGAAATGPRKRGRP